MEYSIVTKKSIAGKVATYVLLAFGAAIMLFPFLWMISASFMTAFEIASRPIQWLPSRIHLDNYRRALEFAPFGRYFFNNMVIAVVGTAAELFTSIMAAYVFARKNFYGKSILFAVLLGTMMVPNEVLIIQNFVTIAEFGWINTFLALIVPGTASIFSIFLVRQFFLSIPIQLSYAAKVDGCRDFRFLWMVMVPLAKPALATMIVLAVIGSWNSFMWPLIVTNTPDMRTLPVGLAMFRGEAGSFYELLMAASVIVALPMILLFVIMQKQIVNGIARSGIKG